MFHSAITGLNGATQVSKSALIVDDSRSARVVLKQVLETHNLDVDTAESAEDALDYLTRNRPDVIFMDHLMPGMDGFEAVTAIKRNPKTATIPIMMYTSQKGEVYVGQARALGAIGVLPKQIAPVEVSRVLKSLHIIGGDKPEQSSQLGNQVPVVNESRGKFVTRDPLNQDLRMLIQDLFVQQRAIIHRDLHDGYESIASRLSEELRPTPPKELVELPLPQEQASSGFIRVVTVLLAVLTAFFAWLYWQKEQSLQEAQIQNTELQKALASQRIIDEEELQRAVESQRITDTEDSQQTLQQISNYQKLLNNMYAVSISNLEWAANQASEYHYGEQPLGDERLKVVEQLTDFLLAISFSGIVRIETHVANYCLKVAGPDGYIPAVDIAVSECDKIGLAPEEAYELGLGQSVAFANFIRITDDRSGGQIRYDIVTLGNSDPLLDYPVTTDGVTARTWNRTAAVNNRVVISIKPDN